MFFLLFKFMWECPWEEIYSILNPYMTGENFEWHCLPSIESLRKGANDVKNEQTTCIVQSNKAGHMLASGSTYKGCAGFGLKSSQAESLSVKDVRSSRPSLCCPCLAPSSWVSFHLTDPGFEFLALELTLIIKRSPAFRLVFEFTDFTQVFLGSNKLYF